jgi:rod shape-determining protein MreD
VRALWLMAAVATAVVLQTSLAGFLVQGAVPVDLVLIVLVYVALTSGPVAGVLVGTAGGLVQDALSSGILGMGGLAKTLVGFLVGRFGTQFIVTATVPRFLVFAAASVAHAGLLMGAYTLLGVRSFPNPFAAVAVQALGNGVLGVLGFQLAEWLPQMMDRHRSGRGMRVKR